MALPIFMDYALGTDLLCLSLESCSNPSGGCSLDRPEIWEQEMLWDVILVKTCCSIALWDRVCNEPPEHRMNPELGIW